MPARLSTRRAAALKRKGSLGEQVAKRITLAFGTDYPPEIARRIGASRVTVQNWLNDHRLPEAARLVQIARLTGASLDWLLGFGEDADSVEGVPMQRAARALPGAVSEGMKRLLARRLDEAVATYPDESRRDSVRQLFEAHDLKGTDLVLDALRGYERRRAARIQKAASDARRDVQARLKLFLEYLRSGSDPYEDEEARLLREYRSNPRLSLAVLALLLQHDYHLDYAELPLRWRIPRQNHRAYLSEEHVSYALPQIPQLFHLEGFDRADWRIPIPLFDAEYLPGPVLYGAFAIVWRDPIGDHRLVPSARPTSFHVESAPARTFLRLPNEPEPKREYGPRASYVLPVEIKPAKKTNPRKR